MAARILNWEAAFKAGLSAFKHLIVPISVGTPAGPAQGQVWLDTTGPIQLAFYDGAAAVLVPLPGAGGLTQEQVEDFIATMITDNADLDWTYDDGAGTLVGVVKAGAVTYAKLQDASATSRVLGRITAGAGDYEELTGANVRTILGTLDADTLGGSSAAALQTAIVNAISNGAGAAYDTLIELQNLMAADDTETAGIITSVGLRARFFAGAIPSGATTGNIDHNLALANIGDYTYRTYVTATGITEEYAVAPSTLNRVIVTDESGGNIPAGRRIFLTAGV